MPKAYPRLLSRLPPDTAALWQEVEPLIDKRRGLLVIDDTTPDKPYAQKMGLVTRHWSGKHHAVVEGISLTTLVWTDGLSSLPCDCRLYEPAEEGATQITKNDIFWRCSRRRRSASSAPKYLCFDGWYSSLAHLKAVRGYGWHLLTRLKSNRQVNPGNTENVAVKDIDIPAYGPTVHLKGFGFVQVFRTVALNGNAEPKIEHWATDDLKMEDGERSELVRQVFAIENCHRQLKQCCSVERAQVRSAKAQKCHILSCVCEPLCAWKLIACRQASAATSPKQTSFVRPFDCIYRSRPFS